MEATDRAKAGRELGWGDSIRRAPVGVLVLGALLAFVAAGLVIGGVYLAFARGEAGWMGLGAALVGGPLIFYVVLHLLRLSHWAWLAIVVLLALLIASSVLRALSAPESTASPLVEIVVEVGFLVYLARRPVRRAFGWA